MKRKQLLHFFYIQVALSLLLVGLQGCTGSAHDKGEWPSYLGGDDRNHYSALSQIDTSNVNRLREAWVYHTGDSGEMQCNPLIIDGKLYGLTASSHLFAVDAATGKELWRFGKVSTRGANRGIAYWHKGRDKRLLFTSGENLYAVDAGTGKAITSFGDSGRVSLRTGLFNGAVNKYVSNRTPGTIYQDLIIMPLTVSERVGSTPGYIQAFNVVTGKLAWVFKTVPHPGELGYDTWPEDAYKDPDVGGANSWAGMSIDQKRGIVYIPTGSAAFDFYGGNRAGENLFSSSLLALDAKTGKYIWHYQTVRHDTWDRDLPSPPNLTTIRQNGKTIDVVAQVTKNGHIFVFNRETGESIYPIDEMPVPTSGVDGEALWPTQPIPRWPLPFARHSLSESDIGQFSDKRDSLVEVFRNANKGLFQPLGFMPTVIFPGSNGGANWGGAAVDKQAVLYINSSELPWLYSLSPIQDMKSGVKMAPWGQELYLRNCASCHRTDRSGFPQSGYPALTDLKGRMSRDSILQIIAYGKGMMPGFTHISEQERRLIADHLLGEKKVGARVERIETTTNVPYVFNGYQKFLDENQRYPAISPPWGTLTAIDLNTGEHLWQTRLGEFKELTAKGIPITGTENYGGPVVTAGGLLFIAATQDKMIRAFAKDTGKLMWEHELPTSGFATPSTYQVNGKQYVVIACGGTKIGMPKGDSYVAFALP